ncbi:acyl-CoA dehydrogenase family protein [Chloroflexota bacterium]
MNCDFTESQKTLKTMARGFLEKECPKAMVREILDSETGYSTELWQTIAELGWTSMPFPEKYGGEEADLIDMVVLYEEVGRALMSTPHLTSVILSGLTILKCGSEVQKDEFIPKIAKGELIFTLALTESEYRWDAASVTTTAIPDGDSYVIKGTKLLIPYANIADHLLVVAKTGKGVPEESISLFIVDAQNTTGLTCKRLSGNFTEPLCEVTFENVKVPNSGLSGEVNKGWPHLQEVMKTAIVLLCAETVGGVEFVSELTVNYTKERMQFGQYIGAFQRIQDRIINIVNALDRAKWLTYDAAWRLSEGMPCNIEVSAAKAYSSAAYTTACQESAHVHAGTGFLKDYDLWLYHKKAWTTDHYLGSTDYHRKLAAKELLDTG